jgi:phosphomannomutase/phosphoglucomutase
VNQPETKAADVDVSVGKNLLRARLLRGLAIILIPAVVAFAALMQVRVPQLEAQVDASLSALLAEDRAAAVADYNRSVLRRLSALGALAPEIRDAAGPAVLPEAVAIRTVPLGDLGTVNLSPGDHQLGSHIEIDLVRRAFNGENPPPEAVRHNGAWRLIYARAFRGENQRGVMFAELPIATIAEQLKDGDPGVYTLVQQANNAATPVIGPPLDSSRGYTSAQVGNSQWFIRFQSEPDWLADLLTGHYWILIAGAVTLAGILLGGAAILSGIPTLLREEIDRILESAENKTALSLQVPPLLPLARLFRQMALLTRRQLITAARKNIDNAEEQPQEEPEEAVPDAPDTEALAAELAIDQEVFEERDDGIPVHIFRSADIRGRTSDELTDQLVERICKAVAVLAQRRGIQTLAVAHDGRPSSDQLRVKVVKTLLASGRDVIELGAAPSPLLYFATHESEYDSGIMITGGHNSDDINGLRFVFQRQLVTNQGIQEILEALRDGVQEQGKGRTIKLDVQGDYLDKVALDVGVALPLRIVVDCNFGAAARLTEEVFAALGCELVIYNQPTDGQRPDDSWSLSGALQALGEKVRTERADLGLLFDSDGDRLHTVTNEGQPVATDQLMMILARDLLERNPGADVVYDVQCTRHFAPFITRCGGRAVISRSGHANVRAKMAQTQALLGGEFSGHVFLTDRWYNFDDGIYTAARLVELLSTSSESYHEMLRDLPKYISSEEITVSIPLRERRQLIRELTTAPDYPGSRVTTLDGLRVDYSDSWGLVQASSTDDTLVFRFEGNDDEALARVQGILREAVLAKMPDLELPF